MARLALEDSLCFQMFAEVWPVVWDAVECFRDAQDLVFIRETGFDRHLAIRERIGLASAHTVPLPQ